MNPVDAPFFPILTALNLHPLHRRQGTVVLRRELVDALNDLSLTGVQLPEGKLIDAAEVEHLLNQSGISVDLVSSAIATTPWAAKKTR